ncbi:MAG: response regulator [Burkholderiaceae bacterium]
MTDSMDDESTLPAPLPGAPHPQDDYCGTTHAARVLGLSVATVQGLVERGEIEAWKTQGGHRRLLLASVHEYLRRSQARQVPAVAEPRRLRVLIVEDDAASRELYLAFFEQWELPLDCIVVPSALEAILEISGIQPDVLITDLNMPSVDGFEMLRVLNGKQQLAGMHVLVVSGLGVEGVAARGELPPGTIVRPKPVNFDWLHGYVSALAASRRQR